MTELPLGHTAVMASRTEAKDSADYFPTPPWATRALVQHVLPAAGLGDTLGTVWEPACGGGHMARVLEEYTSGMPVIATDLFDYGFGKAPVDFLSAQPMYCRGVSWIITNPPFHSAIDFALHAIERAHHGVAMLCRLQWIEGIGRYDRLFKPHPPTLFAPFVERVPMVKGRWDPDASTATSYAWFVWIKGKAPLAPFWIPPGRRQALTKSDDRLRFGPLPPLPELHAAVAALEN